MSADTRSNLNISEQHFSGIYYILCSVFIHPYLCSYIIWNNELVINSVKGTYSYHKEDSILSILQ